MWPRTLLVLAAVACAGRAAARPVRRTLSFNMFVLQPHEGAPERTVLTTDGISRFGPIIEYLVQRVQGLMSVRHPPERPDDALPPLQPDAGASRAPDIVVRPSASRPGTYEVEIDVVLDDGQPESGAEPERPAAVAADRP